MNAQSITWLRCGYGLALAILAACSTEHANSSETSGSTAAAVRGDEDAHVGIPYPPRPWPEGCTDADLDLWPVCDGTPAFAEDCDDGRADIHPGDFVGDPCDGVDNDCDGEVDENDACGDVDDEDAAGARPVIDGSVAIDYPPRPWPAGCTDADFDLWPACEDAPPFTEDCDDSRPDIHPGDFVGDPCDGVDNDCDGEIDENDACTPVEPTERPAPSP